MIRSSLLLLALLGACHSGGKAVSYDFGTPDISVQADCAILSQCIATCAVDGGVSESDCEATCRAQASQSAISTYDQLTQCVTATCSGEAGDGGDTLCADPNAVECQRCLTNSRYKSGSECDGAPSYCGACATFQTQCTGS